MLSVFLFKFACLVGDGKTAGCLLPAGDEDGRTIVPLTVNEDGDGKSFVRRGWFQLSNNQWLASPLPHLVRTLSYIYTHMGWPFVPQHRADPCGHLHSKWIHATWTPGEAARDASKLDQEWQGGDLLSDLGNLFFKHRQCL